MNDQPGQNQQGSGDEPRYTHQNWQAQGGGQGRQTQGQSPQGMPPQAQPPYSQGGPAMPSRNAYTAPKRGKSAVLPVLVSVFLTFVMTLSLTWGLASQGILPGTAKGAAVPVGQDISDLGISVHSEDPAAKAAADKLASVINVLRGNYYKVLSPSEVIEAMTEGVVNSMDSKYTYYMTSEDFQSFTESMSGNYSGIGATVTMLDNGSFELVSVLENGPAAANGLLPGDIIVSVDGRSAEEFTNTTELATSVKGPDGTTVKLVIWREGEEIPFSIVRARVTVELIQTRMIDEITGYMQITEFAETLPLQFKVGLQELLDQGASQIIFDMRNNPGGSAQALIETLDLLLPEGIIATTRGRQDGEIETETWTSDAEMMVPEDMRYAILVNGGTASAAELFSGALRDYDKAVLIGETTYGKGSGTRTFRLNDGSALNVTIFNYYLPKGEMIEETGLAPQIETEPVSLEFRSTPVYRLTPEQDPSLKAALEYFAKLDSLRTP